MKQATASYSRIRLSAPVATETPKEMAAAVYLIVSVFLTLTTVGLLFLF